jgi:hypothetical protein
MNPPVRKVVLGLGISLDGYIARLDGTLDFLFMPKDYSMAPSPGGSIPPSWVGRRSMRRSASAAAPSVVPP